MQAHSLVAGPQVPTRMEEREHTLWAALWWVQLETEHWMFWLACMRLFMGKTLLFMVCP